MSANVGDRIRMHSNSVDAPDRTGTVVAVLGTNGPPYRVRFDSGEETIVTPGPDATFEPPTWSEKLDQVSEQVAETADQAKATVREKIDGLRDTARTKADEMRDTARSKADEVRGTAREKGEGAQKAAGDAARSVADAAEKIAKRFER